MKRRVIASVFGLALSIAAVTPASADGYIYFSNYYGTEYVNPVRYALADVPPGTAGQLVDHTFSAALYAGIGTLSDPGQLTFVPGSITTFDGWPDLQPAWAGWLTPAHLVTIPGY